MKITNFKLLAVKNMGREQYPCRATVDVTKGIWPFRKTRTIEVARNPGEFWYFADTGKFTPSFVVHELERAYLAKPWIDLNNPQTWS